MRTKPEITPDINIEAILKEMEPPTLPCELYNKVPKLQTFISGLDKSHSLSILGGLQTLPEFQANTVRLDWAMRLVAADANGTRRLKRTDWDRFLNSLLGKSGVNRLEDPIEDFFVAPILTSKGEFSAILSCWQNPTYHAEQLIEAFSQLPDGGPKEDILASTFAILSLSDALVQRAGLDRRMLGSGQPANKLKVPSQRWLNTLPSVVRFTWAEVKELIPDSDLLLPYILPSEEAHQIADHPVGNALIDYKPLLASEDGITVFAPGAITTAIRGLLINTAVTHRMGRKLQKSLNDQNAKNVKLAGLEDLVEAPDMPVGELLIRQSVKEISAGRYVHTVLAVDGFNTWADEGFSGTTAYENRFADAVFDGARFAKKAAENRPGFKEGLTLLLLGGWGQGRALEFEVPEDLRGWQIEYIEPSEAALFAGLDDAKLSDLWRIWRLARVVHGMGFELHNPSGFLNLFQWWRESDHAFIPEHELEMVPPCNINFGSDRLLEARKEAVPAIDRRVIDHPDGKLREVMRVDPRSTFSRLEDIYASVDDLEQGKLLGAVLAGSAPVWVSRKVVGPRSLDEYENWRTILRWLELLIAQFEDQFPAFSGQPVLIEIDVEWPDASDLANGLKADALPGTTEITANADTFTAQLRILRDWHGALNHEDNRAERFLAEQLLSCVAQSRGIEVTTADIRELVNVAIGSNDVRWRHAFVVERPIETMRASGLLDDRFRPVPTSAAALIKCCSAFSVADAKPGQKITGADECYSFLAELHSELLMTLCNAIAQFDREAMVVAALDQYQAALVEERSWSMTARALQAIHGLEEDRKASFERRGEINSVIRGCSILAEIAASHASTDGGLAVGEMDLDEFQAAAIQVFSIADMIPALRGGQIAPEIAISPTGHILLDYEFHDTALGSTVRVLHSKDRVEHSNAYAKFFAKREAEPQPVEQQALFDALQSEFGVPAGTFLELGYLLADLAIERRQSTFTILRSELIGWLDGREVEGQPNFKNLVDRLTLASRPNWQSLPEGTSERDFDIARFDRRHSLIGRPLVALNADPDPLIAVAPALVERAARHNIGGASAGGLQGEFWVSKQMRSYVGGAGERLGMEFNERVAEAIGALGLSASASVKPSACLNQKATDTLKRLGDIDVLAFTPDGRRAWVIEVKDIKLCRTLSETAKRLSEYRGLPLANGKPDNLLRHLNRVEYVRENAADLAKRNKLPAVPEVHGLVVVDVPQPMTFVTASDSPDARFVTVDALEEVDWSAGEATS
ncbi:hypothetical protein [Parasphingorhabdus cellanae]|uniref:DUF3883 domain-containing protein n=1 Tax=Parasphingorhabdus cellanae TaxID=2806553 RepID=A0ABX7TA60_9SPHN|nr:hypothetical protein [Parasphingorhabdus cellanae]QTD57300.1 hypothetical protein J4G78_07150 [Parasphingorhabdus cellanae]